jgi:NADPH:quinone reductase-like Zn-dependent oxidoreductase
MKAVQFAEYGGPEVLKVVDVEQPHARPGQIRIAVHAAGVNAFDWKVRSGRWRRSCRSIFLPVSGWTRPG